MDERTETTTFRLTPEQKAELDREAKAAGVKLSDVIRDKLFPPKAELPPPRDGDDLDARTRELESGGLPHNSARILAARERSKAEGAPQIGDAGKRALGTDKTIRTPEDKARAFAAIEQGMLDGRAK